MFILKYGTLNSEMPPFIAKDNRFIFLPIINFKPTYDLDACAVIMFVDCVHDYLIKYGLRCCGFTLKGLYIKILPVLGRRTQLPVF